MSKSNKNLENQENIKKRRELIFVYSVRDANPNGDPDDENRPRTDDEGYVLVSDVRLKRTIRDYLLSNNNDTLIRREYKENGGIYSMEDLILKAFDGKSPSKDDILEKIPKKFIDTRLFGLVAMVSGASTSLTGPVQFAIGKSLNKPTIVTHTITSVASGASDKGGGIGNYHILDYALIRFEGVICPKLAKHSSMTKGDLKILYKAMWYGTQTLNTRSKINHIPKLLLSFRSNNAEFLCGELAYQLKIDEHVSENGDPLLIMDKLIDRIKNLGKDNLDAIEYYKNAEFTLKYKEKEYKDFTKLWEAVGLENIKLEKIKM
ncbi:MAG: type I-B CRISPR-associated protein Cas7/Csh2 [Candidatus Helarchaeota archaeon]